MIISRASVRVVLLVCIVLLVLVGVSSTRLLPDQRSPLGATPAEDLKKPAYWEGRIQSVGGTSAYVELGKDVSGLTFPQQHIIAHAFGGALYATEGDAGIGVCDGQYSFGCFHEFLGHAIVEEGHDSIPRLNDLCWSRMGTNGLTCQHGIGHGVMASELYSIEGLRTALAVCAVLPRSDPIGGCYGGVFMEFYLQTMLGDKAKVYAGALEDAYGPCESVDAKYLDACAFWTPQWWNVAFFTHEPQGSPERAAGAQAAFVKMGDLCEDWNNPRLTRSQCFEGIGNIAPVSADYDTARVRDLCFATSDNPTYVGFCIARAANNLSVDVGRGAAESLCAVLTGEVGAACVSQLDRNRQAAPAPQSL